MIFKNELPLNHAHSLNDMAQKWADDIFSKTVVAGDHKIAGTGMGQQGFKSW